MESLKGLNEAQKRAVMATEGYVRVIAGAGTGKTRTLTRRYGYLVEAGGVSPGHILAVTFTNKAAGELRDRLSAINAQILNSMGRDGSHDPFYGAPVVLVVLADRNVPTCIHDGSLVMGNLMLAASELGVGSCWIHRAKETFETEEGLAILRDLGVEGDYVGVGNCVLGYPQGEIPAAKPRKASYVYRAE